jgi:hypothetical protein
VKKVEDLKKKFAQATTAFDRSVAIEALKAAHKQGARARIA